MIKKLRKNSLLFLITSIIVFFILLQFSDIESLFMLFENFGLFQFAQILVIILISIFVKFIKWNYYLKASQIKILFWDSLLFFFSGLSMSFTPGKIGELVKVYFIQSKYQYAKSRTTGIIAAERVTEFISLFILCSLGILFLNHNIILFSLVFLFLLVILSFILSKKMMENVIKFASKWNFVRKKNEKIKQLFISTHELLVGKNLIIGLILSITAWIIEGFAFYLILSKFVFTENFIWINFTYFISIFVGSVSMLPGGIGTTEGSLTYLLVQKGIENNIAVFSTYVIRMATLWFSTLIGIGSLIVFLLTSKFRLSEILKNDD